jgi:hypothetical protein
MNPVLFFYALMVNINIFWYALLYSLEWDLLDLLLGLLCLNYILNRHSVV